MNDEDFARLVEQAGQTTRAQAATLDAVVARTRDAARRRPHRRRGLVVGVAVAGAVLLAAAASSSYWTKLPPFQSVDADMYRTQTAIPVDFTMQSGQRVHCEAFLEFKYLSVTQSEQAERYVQQHDWSGFGQSMYNDGATPGESYEDAQARRGQMRRDALADQLRSELAAGDGVVGLDGRERDSRVDELRDLVRALPEQDREIFALHVWEGFPLVQIAEMLELPAGTVRSRYSRARASLRAHLDPS